jgi:hypothetical protein
MKKKLEVRPYQLLCLTCSVGEGNEEPKDAKLKIIFKEIRKNPDIPVTLRCNMGGVFSYQDCGSKDDSPEGFEFNLKRDLDILRKIDMSPGITMPARIILYRIWDRIKSVSGICGYDEITSDAWKGCEKAKSGFYEKGHEKGVEILITPRNKEEMKLEKEKSLEVMYKSKVIKVRPHLLLCAVCQYGGGIRPPFKEDNLPEMLQFLIKNPDIKIKLVPKSDWMICAPCPNYNKKYKDCIGNLGRASLYNDLKDLNFLQRLGLKYGVIIDAKEIYRLIFEKIPTVAGVCALENFPFAWLWHNGCGEVLFERIRMYEKGREMLIKEFKLK